MEHQFSELYFNKAITALQVSDIPNLSQLKSTDDYRSLGNGFYKNDQYCQALCVYSKGLMLNPTSVVLLANKAKTFLKMRMFGMCLRNCDKVLLLEPTNRNASLCRIKALSHAINIPELELTEDLQQLLSTIERNKQEADGTFDFPSIYRQNLNRKPQRLWDHFEYIGPVTIQQLSNAKGRGLVATSDINAGQLIIAAKALECAFQSDKWSRFESPFDELLQRLINRCLIDFESVKTLLKLYAGPDVDQLSEMEVLEIANKLMKDPNRKSKIEAMCERAVLFTTYGKNIPNGQTSPQSSFSFSTFSGMGLWVLPSYINHDCYSNAASVVVGDFMFVRAVRGIQCGEEITQPYCVPIGDLQEREESLKRYGFTCQCRLCEFDRLHERKNIDQNTKRKATRNQILALVERMASNQQSLKDPIETLIVLAEKFQEELSYHNRFDVDLMLIWKSIAEICVKNLEFGLAQSAYEKAKIAWEGKNKGNFLTIPSCVAIIPILQELLTLNQDNPLVKAELEKEIKELIMAEYGVSDFTLVVQS